MNDKLFVQITLCEGHRFVRPSIRMNRKVYRISPYDREHKPKTCDLFDCYKPGGFYLIGAIESSRSKTKAVTA